MRGATKTIIVVLAVATALSPAVSAESISLTTAGVAYVQDFNTLANNGTSTSLPLGWATIETGPAADSTHAADDGSNPIGDTYSYGSAGSTDRALGSLRDSPFTSPAPAIAACFVNNTGHTIVQLSIELNCEQWRLGDANRQDLMAFFYSTTATSPLNGAWYLQTQLALTTPNPTNPGAHDGNIDRTAVSGDVLPGLRIPNGQMFWVQWRDSNVSGPQDGLAIDDFRLTPFTATTNDGFWNVDSDGSTSAGANWSGGMTPGGVDSVATFGSVISAPRTITVDAPLTLGVLNFTSSHSYSVLGTSTITLNASVGSARIDAAVGSHTLAAPLHLATPSEIEVRSGATLTLGGDVTAAVGAPFIKTGPGVLNVRRLRLSDRLDIRESSVVVLPSAQANDPGAVSRIKGTPLFAGSGSPTTGFDLTNNALVIDYDDSQSSPAPLLRTFLRIARQQGWGIRSVTSSMADATTHAPGYADNSVTGFTEFLGQPVDPTTVVLKFTYYGDADLDGDVDVTDLGALASHWQATGTFWTSGDFDYTGRVDVADLGLLATNWQRGVTNPQGPGLSELMAGLGLPGASVPEPTIAMLLVSILTCRLPRRQAR